MLLITVYFKTKFCVSVLIPVRYVVSLTGQLNNMKKLIPIFPLWLIATSLMPSALAEKLSIDGEIRERFEIWDGLNKKAYGEQSLNFKGKKTGNANDHLWLQRFIFGLTYQSKWVTAKIHLYDARVWGWSLEQNDFIKNKGTGDEYVMDPYEEHFDLVDGYLETQSLV